jgi:hypothetical protein
MIRPKLADDPVLLYCVFDNPWESYCPWNFRIFTQKSKTRKVFVVETRNQMECVRWPLILKIGQGHPPFLGKTRIFNSFIKANSELLNHFLTFSADYHNFKKEMEKSGIQTRVAWAIGSDHTTPASHISSLRFQIIVCQNFIIFRRGKTLINAFAFNCISKLLS